MEKSIKEFKAEYTELKAEIKQIKQKLREVRKLADRVGEKAWKLDQVGNKTMYNKDEKTGWLSPKFKGLPKMMDNLENWLVIGDAIDDALCWIS